MTQNAGFLGSAAPAYNTAPSIAADPATAQATADGCEEPERITVLIPRELLDPNGQTTH